ncbi:MAG: hypothetical protein SFZ24_03330 [Planctomycetota bacterium]|nr:hypothetical protein [Planctomycetota bacterium]
MANSPESLSKVRTILRKMDQSIDAARNRRLQPPAAPAPVPATSQSATIGGPVAKAGGVPVPAPLRARPLARPMQPRPTGS